MSGSNPTHAALVFLLIFSISSFKISYCTRNNGFVCPEIEKHSLLNFKQSLKNHHNLLSSWDGEVNCCKWEGVICSNFTGHVHQLHVHGLSGKINPSLLNLKHLRYLDLSQNNFTGQIIPSFIGTFTNMEYLNLSKAGFHGEIPKNIGNLANLHTLDLAGSYGLYVDRLEWLSGLSELEYLNMNGVDLSKATNWAQVINTVPSLLQVHFQDCNLDFMAPLDNANITSLAFLDLSQNFNSLSFGFPIPRWIFQLSNLLFIDLSYSGFGGPFPTLSNATKLQHIDLFANDFNSTIPDWLYFCKDLEFVDLTMNLLQGTISNAVANLTSLDTLDLDENQLSGKIPREIGNLCKIKRLGLSDNRLHGEISDTFRNMSECFIGSLKFLYLGYNQLSGHLIDHFGEFKSLQFLDLSRNLLSGAIPTNLGKLSSLENLWLNGNKFTGKLPDSLGQLFNLKELRIADNRLEGIVAERHFAELTKLETFWASGNHLTLNVSPKLIPPVHLRVKCINGPVL